jgi:hypothetical protein
MVPTHIPVVRGSSEPAIIWGPDGDPPHTPTCNSSCQTIVSVCGNGIVEPGESFNFPDTGICVNCQLTNCALCFSFSDPCQGLNGTALSSCQGLLSCLFRGKAECFFIGGPASTACYCSDATCSAGANGSCAPEFNAVAGTTDPAVVVGQLNDPASFLNQLRNVAKRLGNDASCGMFCGGV